MTAHPAEVLLAELRAAGYRPEAEGGKLQLHAPNGTVPDELARRVVKVKSKLLRLLGDPDEAIPADELLEELALEMESGKQLEGWTLTGFPRLDKALGGITPGSMVVLAARPGVGKTTLAEQIAAHVATVPGWGRGSVLYCSYEMSGLAMARRLATLQTHVPRVDHRPATYRQAKGLALYFHDHDKSFGALTRRIQRFRLQHEDAKLVVIDQLGLLDAPGPARDRVAEVRTISRGLKSMAMSEQLPILVLHQLGRQVDNRPDKRPTRSDLRDSGAVEEDADQVVAMHRDSYHDRNKREDTLVELGVLKNREGEDGAWLKYDWDRPANRYTERPEAKPKKKAPPPPEPEFNEFEGIL